MYYKALKSWLFKGVFMSNIRVNNYLFKEFQKDLKNKLPKMG